MRDGTCASTSRTAHPDDNVHQVAHPTTRILETFPAGGPRGSWPAEEYAARRRAEGIPATVVMNLATDTFVVKAEVTV
jgi:hypothetical protein